MVRKTLTLFHYWNEPADKAPQNKNNKQDVYPTSSSVAFKLYFLFKTYLYAACAHLHSIPNELLQLQIDSIYSIRQYALNWDYTSSASSWRNHNITWVASDRHKNTHHLYHTSHLLTLRSLFQHAKSTHVECRAAGFSHYVVLQSQVYNCFAALCQHHRKNWILSKSMCRYQWFMSACDSLCRGEIRVLLLKIKPF